MTDPRQAGKLEHDQVDLPVVAANAVLLGADTFVEIELRPGERNGPGAECLLFDCRGSTGWHSISIIRIVPPTRHERTAVSAANGPG